MTRTVTNRVARLALAVLALALLVTALVACGGPQQPPSEGECREWREWVPPAQQEDGTWREGYCQDRADHAQ